MAKLSKKKKWLIFAVSVLIIAVSCVGVYLYQKGPDRASLSAEETLALYMEYWQDQDYDAMLELLYPEIINMDNFSDEYFIANLLAEEVLEVVSIAPDETCADAPLSPFHPYDQVDLRVTYLIASFGGSQERKFTYLLIQPEKGGAWYIADGGPGP